MNTVQLSVIWHAILSVVDEQAASLQRAAFSPIVRESGDLASALFDRHGRMIAQAVTGTPGHHNSLAQAVPDVLAQHPPERFSPGDAVVVNDPYLTTGQLLDISVIVPVWRGGQIIAYVASTVHHTDVGGYGMGAGARDVFEEGLWIPILKLMREGRRNDDVWDMILANVRTPDLVRGDLHAQVASAEIGARRLGALCDTHGLDDIDEIADQIVDRSREAVRESIRSLGASSSSGRSLLDLVDGTRVEIAAEVRVDPDAGTITVDYTGSSPASPFGINVARNYTFSYTAFVLRSVVNPEVPNNAGSLEPIVMVTEPGSIVDAQPPAPCTARHLVGMFLPMPVLHALAEIAPERVIAEGAAALWTVQVQGRGDDGRPFTTSMFSYAGGMGARATKRGLDTTGYPTGLATTPVEIIEQQAPLRFLRKQLRPGSGGAGEHAGGDGQVVEFTVETGHPWLLNAVAGRLVERPRGILGGQDGAGGQFLVDGEPVRDLRKIELASGAVVHMALPGGGGYGRPGANESGHAGG